MGYVKYPDHPLLSTTTVIMESGKQLKTFWKDKTINNIIKRTKQTKNLKYSYNYIDKVKQ